MLTSAESLPATQVRSLAGLAMLALALWLAFGAGIERIPLFDVDEGAFSEATLEMIASGNYALTTLNGQPRYDKPMLAYWAQAASVSLFGVHEFAFRLPSVLAALAWGALVWRFARQRFDGATADAALLIFACTLGVCLIGRAATADSLLNLCLAGTAFSIFGYAENGRPREIWAAYAWMGFGVLTKGPIAIAIPLLASLVWFGSYARWRELLRAYLSPLGWSVLLAIVLPWAYASYRAEGWAFFEGFVLTHNLGRYTDTMEGHGGRLGYYFPVLMLILLPWTALFMRQLSAARRQWADPFDRWAWTWLGVTFVIFSLSATQLPHYILYGISPLVVLLARHRHRLVSPVRPSVLPFVCLLLFLLLPLALPWFEARFDDRTRALLTIADQGFTPLYYGVLGASLLAVALVTGSRRFGPWPSTALTGLLYLAAVSLAVLPAWARIQQAPVREAGRIAAAQGADAVVVGLDVPSFSVYRGAPTPRRLPRAGELALVRSDRLSPLREQLAPLQLTELYREGLYALVRVERERTDVAAN